MDAAEFSAFVRLLNNGQLPSLQYTVFTEQQAQEIESIIKRQKRCLTVYATRVRGQVNNYSKGDGVQRMR